jgi:hypothetical protein
MALCVLVASAAAAAQSDTGRAPTTEWGEPDLAGVWVHHNPDRRPFQRPLSDADVYEQLVQAGIAERLSPSVPRSEETKQAAVDAWRRAGAVSALVVDPPAGRVPALTDGGRERMRALWHSTWTSEGPWGGPADLGPVERCLSSGVLGAMFPSIDDDAIEIVQSPGVVAIRVGPMHEVRIVPTDGGAHATSSGGYMGDARGRWEDATLIVDSTGFNGRTGAFSGGNDQPTSDRLHLIERFTRRGRDLIDYRIRVDDPATWTSSWEVALQFRRATDGEVPEHACHEWNAGTMRTILHGAR